MANLKNLGQNWIINIVMWGRVGNATGWSLQHFGDIIGNETAYLYDKPYRSV
jgi:hypothetical protein